MTLPYERTRVVRSGGVHDENFMVADVVERFHNTSSFAGMARVKWRRATEAERQFATKLCLFFDITLDSYHPLADVLRP